MSKGKNVHPNAPSFSLLTSSILALGVFSFAACGRGEGTQGRPGADADPPAAAQPMADQVQDLVDRGNEAQREGRYDDALSLYRQAMELAPEHPVPQFGSLMAAMALGDSALADSLRAKLRVSSPDLLGMLNPDGSMGGGMGGGAMPPNPHAGMGGATPDTPPSDPARPGLPPGHPEIG